MAKHKSQPSPTVERLFTGIFLFFFVLLIVTEVSFGVLPLSLRSSAQTPAFLRPEDFGAVGNGVADDTAAIQATVNQAHASGGGTVHLSGCTESLPLFVLMYLI